MNLSSSKLIPKWFSFLTTIIKFFISTLLVISYSQAEKLTTTDKTAVNTFNRSKPNASLIIGGHKAKDGEFPYIVSFREAKYPDYHMGAGSLIKPNWVLTARHVIFNDEHTETVECVVSPKYSNKLSEMRGKKKYKVEKMFCYHDKTIFTGDVAVLKLSENIPLGNDSPYGIQTVPLLESRNDVDWTKEIYVAGWGQNRHTWNPSHPQDYPDHLLVVETPLNSNKECESYLEDFQAPVAFCSGREGKTCGSGDSGGPAIIRGGGKNDVLVGLVSFGRKNTLGPTAFMNVSHFYSWIKDRMRDEDPKTECKNVYGKNSMKRENE
ncbi:chymotrypsinogen A-like [Brevipalpus obovatus]|uniref:chymotrypsinogen A-like n=1 Tax=Brevipalpus obovatus TaxID=246614 RepID=UPI003D9E0CE7